MTEEVIDVSVFFFFTYLKNEDSDDNHVWFGIMIEANRENDSRCGQGWKWSHRLR